MLQMRREKTHFNRCKSFVRTRKTNHRAENTSFVVRVEHRMNESKFCLLRWSWNRIRLHEKRFDAKRTIHSIEKLIVFESSRFQRVLKEMRKRIKQLKKQITHVVESFFFTIIIFSFRLTLNHQLNFDA